MTLQNAHYLQVRYRAPYPGMQILPHVPLRPVPPEVSRPAYRYQNLALSHGQTVIPNRVRRRQRRPQYRRHVRHRVQHHLLRMRRRPHLPRLPRREHRHRALLRRKPALHVQRQPVRVRLVLRDAERVLARMSDYRPVEQPRNRGAGVHQNKPNRPPDSRVRPVARPEQVILRVDIQFLDYRPVHYDQHRRAALAGRRRYQVELRREHRLRGRQHNRKILRQAARHHRVGRRLRHRYLTPALRYLAKNLVRRPPRVVQKLIHPLQRRRHNRQTVRPAKLIAPLYRLYRVAPFSRNKIPHIVASFLLSAV